MHVYTDERLAWLHIEDDLPRAPGSGNSSGIGA